MTANEMILANRATAPMPNTPEYVAMLHREREARAEMVGANPTPDGFRMLMRWDTMIVRAERALASAVSQ